MARWGGIAGAVGAALFLWLSAHGPAVPAANAQGEPRTVEITIDDFAFKVQAAVMKVHEPVRIVLRNIDEVQHGFTSPGLDGLDLRIEARGVITYGRGIKGLYVDPAEEAVLLFTPTKSGTLNFRCDLHPQMKGEIVVLTVGAV